jgi:hypothetical protein
MADYRVADGSIGDAKGFFWKAAAHVFLTPFPDIPKTKSLHLNSFKRPSHPVFLIMT